MGGATLGGLLDELDGPGLSPRGRGNLGPVGVHPAFGRSIPAWAGQPCRRCWRSGSGTVYPRVGGATHQTTIAIRESEGLSPRGRGNPAKCRPYPGRSRSIPAWAGQPARSMRIASSYRVYPRVGGATGSSVNPVGTLGGLSPRGRGNPAAAALHLKHRGSIPAWAGQPLRNDTSPTPSAVYPRVGGATRAARRMRESEMGLSPRGRGNPGCRYRGISGAGSIPAWAGQPGRCTS